MNMPVNKNISRAYRELGGGPSVMIGRRKDKRLANRRARRIVRYQVRLGMEDPYIPITSVPLKISRRLKLLLF